MQTTRWSGFATLLVLALTALVHPPRAQAQECPPGQTCLIVVEQPAPPVATPPPATVQGVVALPPGYGGAPPPPEPIETTRSRAQWRVVIPGAIMLGVGWIFNWLGAIPLGLGHSFFGSDFNFERYFGWSFIPVIGPWVNAAAFDPAREPGSLAYHVVLGLVQGAGLLMAILGTVITEEVTVTRYALDDEGRELELTPLASPQLAGAAARLSF